jgi:CheY-like chemotaxis protein
VAHDFNNLLTVVRSCADALRRGVAEEEARELVAEISDAARRGAELTRQLLTFSRRQPSLPRDVDLNALVAGTQRMLGRLIGEHVRVQTRLGAGLPAVHADPTQLEQVVVNLVVNARDAMPNGGTLTLSTELAEAGEGPDPGRGVVLSVRDEGVGMDEDVLSHLFEPFFTTKVSGKGTGLGLATVFGIVRQAGGSVAVESAPGAGSTFRVYLPASREEAPSDAPALTPPPAARTASGNGETLLVVEDDAAVRSLLCRFLEAEGYRVLEARDPLHALELGNQARPLHALVTDVVMPELNGKELAARLVAARPDLCVLFVSASADPESLVSGTLPPRHGFLAKPFDRGGLAGAVRELLDGAAA